MRMFFLTAVAAVSMSRAADAAIITYTLDVDFEFRSSVAYGFYTDADGVQHDFFVFPPEVPISHPRRGGTVLTIDTDYFDVTGSTIKASLPTAGIGGQFWYSSGKIEMTFAEDGSVTDWSIFQYGKTMSAFYVTPAAFYADYFGAMTPGEWDQDIYGPPPPYDDFVVTGSYIDYRSADGGTWTITSDQPSPVPLPAAASMLLTGAALLAGLRVIRRRA